MEKYSYKLRKANMNGLKLNNKNLMEIIEKVVEVVVGKDDIGTKRRKRIESSLYRELGAKYILNKKSRYN